MHKNFQEAYYAMLNKVKNEGSDVEVRGLAMKELIPGYFEIANPRDRLLNIDCRSNIKKYIFGELMWYLTGRDDVEFINKYSKQWAPLSDDGIHSNSAYGKYIFRMMPIKGWGVDYTCENCGKCDCLDCDIEALPHKSQWDHVKEVLTKDPYSRQAVIHIKPIQLYPTKDVTCTYFLQFFIRNNKLDLVVGMRSNDLLFGTTYDVFMFTFLQELMAAELGVELGVYKHFASNIHFYMKDSNKIEEILSEDSEKPTLVFPEIPANFREYDLPKLTIIEKEYWKNGGYIVLNLYNELSPIGKQLVSFLTNDDIKFCRYTLEFEDKLS